MQQLQIECQIALDRVQRGGPAVVLRNQQERTVVDRIVDADTALDEKTLAVQVNSFGQVRVHRAADIQVGEEPGGLAQSGGDDPAMVRRVEAAIHHAGHGAADELFNLAQKGHPNGIVLRLHPSQLDHGAELLDGETRIRARIVVHGQQVEQAA